MADENEITFEKTVISCLATAIERMSAGETNIAVQEISDALRYIPDEYKDGLLNINSESEGECETCGGTEQVNFAEDEPVDYEVIGDCPNCTDESEDHSESQSEHEVDAEFVKNILWELCDITNRRSVGEYGEIIDSIVERFRELEQEIKNWRTQSFGDLMDENQALRERIKSAKEQLRLGNNGWAEIILSVEDDNNNE